MCISKRILIVDDEEDVRDGVSFWLRSADYDTLSAEDGTAGLDAARTSLPEAILLDVLMPVMDGIETLHELQSDDKTTRIPVIMLSASLREERRAIDAGARFFLPKPYKGKELLLAIQNAMNNPECHALLV